MIRTLARFTASCCDTPAAGGNAVAYLELRHNFQRCRLKGRIRSWTPQSLDLRVANHADWRSTMNDRWLALLESWHEFYLLIGTAGVTLTGLLFVVISFGAQTVASQAATGVRAFVSPNAVFFTAPFGVAAVFLVP